MTESQVELVLDTLAVMGYAAESLSVGETLAEVDASSALFAVPALCLAGAVQLADDSAMTDRIMLLSRHHCALVLPLTASNWAPAGTAAREFGRLDLAAATLAAYSFAAPILTGEPAAYELPGDTGPETIGF